MCVSVCVSFKIVCKCSVSVACKCSVSVVSHPIEQLNGGAFPCGWEGGPDDTMELCKGAFICYGYYRRLIV